MTAEVLVGTGVGTSAAVGTVLRLGAKAVEHRKSSAGPAQERERLIDGLGTVLGRIRAELSELDKISAEIMDALVTLLSDEELIVMAEPALDAGWDAATSLQLAINEFEALMGDDEDFLSRVADLRGIADVVAAEIRGERPSAQIPAAGSWVIVARDLTPVDTAKFGDSVVGVITELGGPTSHTAVICRARGIPAVVACPGASELKDGDQVLVDPQGDRAVIGGALTSATEAIRFFETESKPLISVRANIGSLTDALTASATQATGVGLFRTEVLYLDERVEPDFETQVASYREIFEAAPAGELIVRTIDSGTDKPVPFLKQEAEENPALGVRGFRLQSVHPQFIETQLAAIAAASKQRAVSVMAPMIANYEEAELFASLARAAGLERIGIMVETPAIVSQLGDLAGLIDFVSIGTNDLSQYLFAADRMNSALAALNDPWQPGLIRTVAQVASVCQAAGMPVGVCGESAADPLLAIVYAGLGATSLSVSPAAVAQVTSALKSVDAARAKSVAQMALSAKTAAEAKALVRAELAS
jgi:phosphoenolpyruvate-protein phosphotransferase (PTS system enzyme I)